MKKSLIWAALFTASQITNAVIVEVKVKNDEIFDIKIAHVSNAGAYEIGYAKSGETAVAVVVDGEYAPQDIKDLAIRDARIGVISAMRNQKLYRLKNDVQAHLNEQLQNASQTDHQEFIVTFMDDFEPDKSEY